MTGNLGLGRHAINAPSAISLVFDVVSCKYYCHAAPIFAAATLYAGAAANATTWNQYATVVISAAGALDAELNAFMITVFRLMLETASIFC